MRNALEPLNVVVVGLGYVGATASACMATQGHNVIGVDLNEDKVINLRNGVSPIVEEGLPGLILEGVRSGRLTGSTSIPDLTSVDVVVVCVGTPSAPDGSHNMSYIAESTRQIAKAIHRRDRAGAVSVVYRSTFRPGTMQNLISPLFREQLGESFREDVELVYNPEFLRESTAVNDYFEPPKIVVGTELGSGSISMERLNEGIVGPRFNVGFKEAEITKFVDNSWHAVKVAFANEIGRVCDAYGVQTEQVHDIFVSDRKLNISPYYTKPGGAFGGSCLPKDVRATQFIARDRDVKVELLDSLLLSNASHKEFQLSRILRSAPRGSRILLAGLAFKAGTDDMRESPNVDLARDLLKAGYDVRIFDPAVQESTLVGQNMGYILSILPNLEDLLMSSEDIDWNDFDLVAANNASINGLSEISVPVIDLRTIEVSENGH